MDAIDSAKKRKADYDPPRPGNDDPGTALPANLSLAELNRLIDQRVTDALEAVEAKTLVLTSRVDGLQRENEELLLRCESLERSVQVMKKEGNWTYLAPDVPRSHWIDQGHDEDYVEGAEDLIQSIKYTTHRLRSGDGDGDSDDWLVFDCEIPIPILSDTALNPHWEQLANAVQLSERITRIDISYVQMNERTLQMIEASVRQKGITVLCLDHNQFHGGEGVQFAINVLRSNRTVKYFDWEYNSLHGTEDACDLIDAVMEHPTISDVSFMGSFREDIATYSPVKRLFGGDNFTLRSVDLSNNGIKTNGDKCISGFLSANPPMRSLNLDGNWLNDDDALHIAKALQSNTNLRALHLRNNRLTKDGKDAMNHQAFFGISPSDFSALQTISKANLNTVSGANHTCEIVGIYMGAIMNDCNKDAKWNRRRKLFWLLGRRHIHGLNMTLFEPEFSGDSLGVMPHVLACINTYATTVYAEGYQSRLHLSLLFELARDWKTPEMYQFHHTQLRSQTLPAFEQPFAIFRHDSNAII